MRIISGEYKGRKLKTPKKNLEGYRPATYKVRQAIFSILVSQGMEFEGARVIDLFAGTGSLGFECLSRGATLVYFVENNREAVKYLKINLENFGVEHTRFRIVSDDVHRILNKQSFEKFHLCFIDPPYRKGLALPVIKKLIKNNWVIENGFIVSEVEQEVEIEKEIPETNLIVNRKYGQTRILIWTKTINT
ncbi:16S rRNA (guanine(966)-N(2))-methyltransferase RsmD [Desulfothermus okinawensis JCM 13304]